jgi:hypothetical protein
MEHPCFSQSDMIPNKMQVDLDMFRALVLNRVG